MAESGAKTRRKSKSADKPKVLRVGFIGAGGIADLQLRMLAQRKDVTIAALADINPRLLEKRYREYPDAEGFSNYRQMLKHCPLDAVTVCTPNKSHAAATVAALQAGCHVMVEKPMAMTVAEARRMVRTARQARRKLVIGFQHRYDPRTQYLRRVFDEGGFGNVLYTRVQALRRRGIPNWGVFGRKELQGGGPLIDIGVHALEMAHYAMGCPTPRSASADMFTYLGNKPSDGIVSLWPGWDHSTYNVEDLLVGRIRFSNGAVIHIETAFAAHIGQRSLMNFEIMGDKGGATWEPAEVHTDESGHMVNKTPGWLPDTAFERVFQRKMDGFVDHVLHGQPTICPGTDGLAVQTMLNALYASAANGGRETPIRG